MTQRRWMKTVIATADAQTEALPWARGAQRNRWKAGARSRARAA